MNLGQIVNKIESTKAELRDLEGKRVSYPSQVFFFCPESGSKSKSLYIPSSVGCLKIDPSGYFDSEPVSVCSNSLDASQLRGQEKDLGYVKELTVGELELVMDYIEELVKNR